MDAVKSQWGRLISCIPKLDSIDLVGSTLSLGRAHECDIIIHKSEFPHDQLLYVSKEHFVISKDPEDIYITYILDLSRNGTYINGKLIGRNKKHILQNDDTIAIGEKIQIYIFKSMIYSVTENYLPLKIKKKYEPSRLLGKGACGEVILLYHKTTCKKYAGKKIIKGKNTTSQINNINHPRRIDTEVNILKTVKHPFIVGMKEIVEGEEEVFIVLEYIEGGELSNKLSFSDALSESHTKFLFYQMVIAVQYLHGKGITHRDLKPGNILLSTVDSQTVIKLTDFGLSNVSEGYDLMKTVCGTWYYIAPEVLDPTVLEYSNQVDVWSLGVILFCMLSKHLPFKSEDKLTLGRLIVNGSYTMNDLPWYEVSANAKDLVKKMLVVNPQERITINEIFDHPWIAKDHLMRFQIENLMTKMRQVCSVNDEGKRSIEEEDEAVKSIKRIKLCD